MTLISLVTIRTNLIIRKIIEVKIPSPMNKVIFKIKKTGRPAIQNKMNKIRNISRIKRIPEINFWTLKIKGNFIKLPTPLKTSKRLERINQILKISTTCRRRRVILTPLEICMILKINLRKILLVVKRESRIKLRVRIIRIILRKEVKTNISLQI